MRRVDTTVTGRIQGGHRGWKQWLLELQAPGSVGEPGSGLGLYTYFFFRRMLGKYRWY